MALPEVSTSTTKSAGFFFSVIALATTSSRSEVTACDPGRRSEAGGLAILRRPLS